MLLPQRVARFPNLIKQYEEPCFAHKLLVDDDAITIDSALDGYAEESLIPNLIFVGAGRGAQGATASQGGEQDSGNSSKQNLFHRFLLLFVLFATAYLRLFAIAVLQ